jgi:hypothetical protein
LMSPRRSGFGVRSNQAGRLMLMSLIDRNRQWRENQPEGALCNRIDVILNVLDHCVSVIRSQGFTENSKK